MTISRFESVSLVWITPNAEQLVADIARVSSPENQGKPPAQLIQSLLKHGHWSPFEMVSMCLAINTSRIIARQMLRHRSFSFQEFSQRWAIADKLDAVEITQCRMQNPQDRAMPSDVKDKNIAAWWQTSAQNAQSTCERIYLDAIKSGIAREVARSVLPEGLTPSRLYMSGTVRSWIHYLQLRLKSDTQMEHREIAESIRCVFASKMPIIAESAGLSTSTSVEPTPSATSA